jgi:hypothetical protein
MRTFVDLQQEAPALRRAAVLLERVREDAAPDDVEIELLVSEVMAMQRAAARGRKVHSSAIHCAEAALERFAPRVSGAPPSVRNVIRWNAVVESQELLRRLGQRTRGARTSRA